MSRKLVFALLGSMLLHGALFSAGYFSKPPAKETPAPKVPTIELAPMPALEPEPPEPVEVQDSGPTSEPADLAPPMQADTPSVQLDSPFVQQIQPPPPPGVARPKGVISIPTGPPGSGTGGGGLKNVFDLASLDQIPVATLQVRPNFPFELRRARISGQADVGFIVDSSGAVREPYIISSSHREFEPEAIKALLKWKFRPGRKSGSAVNTRMSVTLVFNAGKS